MLKCLEPENVEELKPLLHSEIYLDFTKSMLQNQTISTVTLTCSNFISQLQSHSLFSIFSFMVAILRSLI